MDGSESLAGGAGEARPQFAHPPAARSLHSAAGAGDCRQLVRLLRRSHNLEDCSHWGAPPLHLAAFSGHLDAVALLLRAGARVNAKDYARMTPLHRAVAAGQAEVVALLLHKGAKVNRRCKEGRSPLHVAAADCRKAALARMLLKGGADAYQCDRAGTTPIHLAEVSGNAALLSPWLRRRDLFLWRRAHDGEPAPVAFRAVTHHCPSAPVAEAPFAPGAARPETALPTGARRMPVVPDLDECGAD